MRRDILVTLILSLFAASFCFADEPIGFENEAGQAMPVGNPRYFSPAAAVIQLPVKPSTITPAAMEKYYNDYLSYIKTLTELTQIARAYKTLLNDLGDTLTSNSRSVSDFTVKAVFDQTRLFLKDNIFSGNDRIDCFLALMGALKVVISNKAVDSGTILSTILGIEIFLGIDTSDTKRDLAGLGNAQKIALLVSFKELAAEIMKADPPAVDLAVKVRAATGLMRLLNANLKILGAGNLARTSAEILNLISDYVKSAEFKSLNSDHQVGVIWNFSQSAKELLRNPADNAANRDVIIKVKEIFKTVTISGNTQVQAFAINELLSLVSFAKQNNQEIANSLLETLQVDDGIDSAVLAGIIYDPKVSATVKESVIVILLDIALGSGLSADFRESLITTLVMVNGAGLLDSLRAAIAGKDVDTKKEIEAVLDKIEIALKFREAIFQGYGFTSLAAEYIRNHSRIMIIGDGAQGGRWQPDKLVVILLGTQHEAALHELSHVWDDYKRIDDIIFKRDFVNAVIKLADMDPVLFSECAQAIALAKAYVYGDKDFKGMMPGVLDVYNLKEKDWDKVNDREMFAGMASFTMGKFKDGERKLPEFMQKFFLSIFTGDINVKPYYEK